MEYYDLSVNVPEPAAFVLHKFIVSERRPNTEKGKRKKEKDLKAAKDIGEFLLTIEEQRNKLIDIYNSLHPKWRKNVLKIIKKQSDEIYDFLEKYKLFYEILKKFDENGILNKIILIGSLCQHLYRIRFDIDETPLLEVKDIDFLIPTPNNNSLSYLPEVSVITILEELKFNIIRQLSSHSGNHKEKFSHSTLELELEFLINKKGNLDAPRKIKKLSISAIPLRYLRWLEENYISMKYRDLSVNVPEPAAFVLHKFILSGRPERKQEKREKDLEAAKSIGEFLLTIEEQRNKLMNIYNSEIPKWRKKALNIIEKHSEKIYTFLTTSKT